MVWSGVGTALRVREGHEKHRDPLLPCVTDQISIGCPCGGPTERRTGCSGNHRERWARRAQCFRRGREGRRYQSTLVPAAQQSRRKGPRLPDEMMALSDRSAHTSAQSANVCGSLGFQGSEGWASPLTRRGLQTWGFRPRPERSHEPDRSPVPECSLIGACAEPETSICFAAPNDARSVFVDDATSGIPLFVTRGAACTVGPANLWWRNEQ